MQELLILCALEQELPRQHNKYRDITFYTGVGKVNAAIKSSLIVKTLKPKIVINFGTAGSCNRELSGLIECGVFTDRDDSSRFNKDSKIITDNTLTTISTGDNFITEKSEGCDLVDMEAYAIAKVCRISNTNFKCYKYVTDYVGSNSIQEWEDNVHKGFPLFLEKLDDYIKNAI
jgi:adenosylhomocysteine nucleosidase